MYQNIPTKVLTGEVRLSYANLTTPRTTSQGDEPKYSVTLLIPKTDVATLKDIENSMNAAYEDGVTKKWAGAHPQKKIILHDGDGLRPSGTPFGEECKGHYVITASSKKSRRLLVLTILTPSLHLMTFTAVCMRELHLISSLTIHQVARALVAVLVML